MIQFDQDLETMIVILLVKRPLIILISFCFLLIPVARGDDGKRLPSYSRYWSYDSQ